MKRKIAFLVPTYPPHFWRARDLVKSFKKHKLNKQADLWFVFTNDDEAKQFGRWDDKVMMPETLAATGISGGGYNPLYN